MRVHDKGSGVRARATSIGFGDGTRLVRGKLTSVHRYGAPGRYRITVRCADRIGNHAVDLVAPGGRAGAPSVSADGRYVSFTTTVADPANPDPTSPQRCSSVYVRDMALPADQGAAYTLVSALNGSTTGLTYAGSTTPGCPGGGSSAADRVAISGDGREVAFTVVGQSNLCGVLWQFVRAARRRDPDPTRPG